MADWKPERYTWYPWVFRALMMSQWRKCALGFRMAPLSNAAAMSKQVYYLPYHTVRRCQYPLIIDECTSTPRCTSWAIVTKAYHPRPGVGCSLESSDNLPWSLRGNSRYTTSFTSTTRRCILTLKRTKVGWNSLKCLYPLRHKALKLLKIDIKNNESRDVC